MDFDAMCSICLDKPNDEAITSCSHRFCRLCILRVLALQFSKKSVHECPVCRQEVTFLTFLKVPTSELEERYWMVIYQKLTMSKMTQSLDQMNSHYQVPRGGDDDDDDNSSDFSFEDFDDSTDSEKPRALQSEPFAQLALVVLPYFIYLVTSRLLSRLRGN